MNILLFNSNEGPDYLADLINYFFLTHNYKLYTNHRLDFLFEDYENKSKLYGKGFTLYGNLDKKLKKKLKTLNMKEIKSNMNHFDLIIFTSIHRNYKKISIKKEIFPKIYENSNKNKIIVIDGEDVSKVEHDIATKSNYFKREIKIKDSRAIKPISFSFPELEISKIKTPINNKTQLLAPNDPRYLNSYIFNENEYFEQYARSIFGVTTKKGGWDCMRHYEILNANTLPYFPNIEEKPKLTMKYYPQNLQIETNRLFKTLILGNENIDTIEKFRLKYYSKSYYKIGIKKIKTKLSKLNMIENNIAKIEELNTEFQNWFLDYGTTKIYKKIFKL